MKKSNPPHDRRTRGNRPAPIRAWVLLLATGCSGVIDQPGSGPDGRSATTETPRAAPDGREGNAAICHDEMRGLSEDRTRRLTRAEILASLRALVGDEVMDQPDVQSTLATLPQEYSFSHGNPFDNTISDVEGLLAVAEAISGAMLASGGLGCDPVAEVEACQARVVDAFAPRAFRRPLGDEERAEYVRFMAEVGGEEGVRLGLVRLMVSPHFHQHLELESAVDTDPQRLRLSPHEVANRLAYRLTGSPPDDALRAAADRGELSTVEDARAHAHRLVRSDAARALFRRAIASWLGVEQVSDPHPHPAAQLDVEPAGLGEEAREELLRFAEHIVYERDGTYRELMTDRTVFPASDRLASLYGVPRNPEGVQLPADDPRGGVLLRIGTLLTAGTLTGPVGRGLFLRSRVLCQPLPPPPDDAVDNALDQAAADSISHETHSSREMIALLTEGPACSGCHDRINPLGFALEELGPLGERRSVEVVFGDDGTVLAEHPIDTAVDDIFVGSDPRAASGAADLKAFLASAREAVDCFAEQWFAQTRFRFPRNEDACVIDAIRVPLERDQPLLEAIVENVANEDLFLRAAPGQ